MKIFKNAFFYGIIVSILAGCGEPQSIQDEKKIIKTALIASTGKLWKNNSTIIVSFLDGTPEFKAEVETFAAEWTRYANLNFAFYPELNKIPRGKQADIVITFNTNVHTSAVGTDSRQRSPNEASMNLGITRDKNINTRRSIILHEFGHAIGLEHEHQHKDRTLSFDEEKAITACQQHINFTAEMCRMFILEKFPAGQYYFSPYDQTSIMHYTLHPSFYRDELDMQSNLSLSLTDKLEIAKLYPGRMSSEAIILTHQNQQRELKELSTYKNCRLVEYAAEKKRSTARGVELTTIKHLIIESVTPGEFQDESVWEDRESTVIRMKNLDYCNLSENELQTSRLKKLADNYENRIFGSCYIPLNTDGTPEKSNCPDGFNYQIFDLQKKKSVDRSCHTSFKNAYDVMKNIPVCK